MRGSGDSAFTPKFPYVTNIYEYHIIVSIGFNSLFYRPGLDDAFGMGAEFPNAFSNHYALPKFYFIPN